ncbi:hypothetical protein CEXT_327251 [Caerostris extrusa]|uniref:Uncharacterized protein n=1 Tax=Caerostris extrusa TaxID=172846 RepID=A0AAV4SR35_CAEEX|nr:hypothetical protein CEXT_327251 [Caerostris extrusa]
MDAFNLKEAHHSNLSSFGSLKMNWRKLSRGRFPTAFPNTNTCDSATKPGERRILKGAVHPETKQEKMRLGAQVPTTLPGGNKTRITPATLAGDNVSSSCL